MQKDSPVRKKIRLQGYDYSNNGAYFITICVQDKRELLGKVGAIINRPSIRQGSVIKQLSGAIINRPYNREEPPQIELSEYGMIVDKAINEISNRYPQITVDKYVIMPNHIHMILLVSVDEERGRLIIAPTSVSTVVQQLKRYVSKQIGLSIWQKSFHDHIIRDEVEYQKIWQYIDENPAKWSEDCYYN